MSDIKHLLIVSHTPSEKTRALTEAVERGAAHPDIEGVSIEVVRPLETEHRLGEFRVGLCSKRRSLENPLVAAFWQATG